MRELSQSVQAVQKRKSRSVQREKRRRSFFIHDYVRTKYPGIFNEANEMYQGFVEKYPSKPDFCKTYYFKKWQRKIDESRSCLMLPHLPILTSPDSLHQRAATSHEQATDEQAPDEQEPEEQAPEEQLHEEVIECGVQNTQQTEETSLQFSQMSLEEIDRAVDQIVTALQADDELRNMVTEFDLPDDVWQNELAIPDYVLETELDW